MYNWIPTVMTDIVIKFILFNTVVYVLLLYDHGCHSPP